MFAQRTNLIAGDNVTGSEWTSDATLKGSNSQADFCDPERVGADIDALTVGGAHGYLIQPLRGYQV
jgi:hypothetical protein